MLNNSLEADLLDAIRVIPDFPQPGIAFRDITTLLENPILCRRVVEELVRNVPPETTAIAGIESRGFLFGMALAMACNLPFVPIRKKGKLPFETHSVAYALEYGEAVVEMHTDAVSAGDLVYIHDDLLATGGSAAAAAELIINSGAQVSGFSFLLGVEVLNGGALLRALSTNITILARC
jgi:adenine phosphoribosyltransferase